MDIEKYNIHKKQLMKLLSIAMKYSSFLLILGSLSICTTNTFCQDVKIKEYESQEEQITKLINEMTVEEKIGQLTQLVPTADNLDEIKQGVENGTIGSLCVTKGYVFTPEEHNELQKLAVKNSRLGIPVLFGFDVIHGFSTIFPSSLGFASSWDELAQERAQSIAASEARHYGMDLAFSPMVDVSRDPRWGRISESAGEDVELNSRMGAAAVRGFQGSGIYTDGKINTKKNSQKLDNSGLKSHYHIGSCVKHFVGYGLSLGGRDKQFTEISKLSLLNTYLPPFKACIDEGAISIMTSFNDISGVPATANYYTLTEILRNQWHFDGFSLSDWDAVEELMNHGIADNPTDAARLAIEAGVDMEMRTTTYRNLVNLFKNDGQYSNSTQKLSAQALQNLETAIDRSVRHVLRMKYRLGLFENYLVDVKKAYAVQFTKENRTAAREIAADCMVLLKNEKATLPLKSPAKIQTVSLIGPYANNQDLLSHWRGFGKLDSVVTVEEGLKNNAPKNIKIVNGVMPDHNSNTVIVCVGEPGNHMGESGSVTNLSLPESQIALVREARKIYKKVIVVVFCGRPRVLTEIQDEADAILYAWHPGTEAGNALADVIFGKVNPSGKTTCTFPKSTGQVPLFYSDRISGRPREDKYIDMDAVPLYPFGYGLSYSTFEYSDLRLENNIVNSKEKDASVTVSVNVTNTGVVDGKEIVQLYIHDKVASVTRPQKELKDFKKVFLKAGETKTVSFTLPIEKLVFYNNDLTKVVEPGEFDLWVGKNSQDLLQTTFQVK